MQANRRKFLSFLGLGAAAGPLAVKAAGDAEIAKLANLGAHGLQVGGFGLPDGSPAVQSYDTGYKMSYEDTVIQASDLIKFAGIPEVIKARVRENSQYVHGLDIDLASKKSWSMAVKVQEQRERNYRRHIEAMENAGWKERGQQALQKTLGFRWPW